LEDPVFNWYESSTGDNLLFTGNPFVSAPLQRDTAFYVTVSGTGYCESSGRLEVNVLIRCTKMRGTVFPFVYTGSEEEDIVFDALFPFEAFLYELPPLDNPELDPLEYLETALPVHRTKAVHYDGSIYVANTPKYPGIPGRTNITGVPIRWMGGRTQDPETDYSVLSGPDDLPSGDPVGVYTFENLPMGASYILGLTRPGYLTRYSKITVEEEGWLNHRYLLPGDCDGNGQIQSQDISALNGNRINYPRAGYNARYDLDANGAIESFDSSLLNFHMNASRWSYQDTYEYLLWFYSNF
jgi:hypothetical protein